MHQRDLFSRFNRFVSTWIAAMVRRRLAAGSIKDEAQRAAASRL